MAPEDAADGRVLSRLAGVCAVLVLVVVAASAYLRLGQAGFSCADWPDCYGRIGANQAVQAAEPMVFWARAAHRLAAVGVTMLVLAILALAFRRRAIDRRSLHLALLALGLTLFLAVLGRWSSGSRVPAVTVGNLLAGFALVGVLWNLHRARPQRLPAPGLARACVLLLGLQVALGGLVSANFAGLSCPGFPGCGEYEIRFDSVLFNPFRSVAMDASGAVERPQGSTGLVATHRLTAFGLGFACLILAWRQWQSERRGEALRLAALIGLTCALGIGIALGAPPLWVVFGHNLVAALLAMTLADI